MKKINKLSDFLTEGLRDKMKPKSEEEIKKTIEKILDNIQNIEEGFSEYVDMGDMIMILESIVGEDYDAKYKFLLECDIFDDEKLYDIISDKLFDYYTRNDNAYDEVMKKFIKKVIENKDKIDYTKFPPLSLTGYSIDESLSDKMVGKSKEELNSISQKKYGEDYLSTEELIVKLNEYDVEASYAGRNLIDIRTYNINRISKFGQGWNIGRVISQKIGKEVSDYLSQNLNEFWTDEHTYKIEKDNFHQYLVSYDNAMKILNKVKNGS
jgi:hypothetical protein